MLASKRYYFLGGLLLSDLTTRSRLSDVDPVDGVDARDIGAHTHPFHVMFRRNVIEEKVSDLFRKAFGQDLVMLRAAGTKASAYVGERPERAAGEHITDGNYLDKVESLKRLESEGDGVRSYASIIGRLVTEERPIQLIDEPEAFLHPPQARKIGVAIGDNSADRQTFIATHSQDVLQGLIATAPDRVSVVRLARFGETRTANHITSHDIKGLWDDPILRYSQVLNGLFHDAVIVAESDYDCRFFQALMEVATTESRPDFHYVHVNGKSRMHLVVHALAKVGVPVACIFDFDILNAEQPLRRTIEANGGNWSDFEANWRMVSGKVSAKSTVKLMKDVAADIRAILKRIQPQRVFEKPASKEIEAAIRIDQPWDHVREVGLDGLYAYGCYNEGKDLLDRLKAIGIFVVPVGQMEGFDREETARKGNWVNAVLQGDLMHERLAKARTFVGEIAEWAATPPDERNRQFGRELNPEPVVSEPQAIE